MTLIRRKPWIPVALFYLAFIILWIWFAWFAIQHSPQTIQAPSPAAGQH